MKKSLIFLLTILAFSTVTRAQSLFNVGLKGGVNIANFGGEKTDNYTGYLAGVVLQYNLPTGLFFQSGIEYTVKGGKWKMDAGDKINFKETLSPEYLQFPLHAGYRMDLDAFSLSISAGGYYAYGVGGSIKRKYNTLEEGDDFKRNFFDSYDKHDFGLGLEITAEFNNLNFSFGHSFGLIPLSRTIDDREYKFKNRTIYFAVGYTIF